MIDSNAKLRSIQMPFCNYRVVKMPVTKGGRLELTITEMGNE
ncbi:endodeoxyribonuclease RUS [Shigella sonnei]|uniref:Endodeoxyribonuclease RUS n=1 Tax=Shigella sonnei TaxID=624 RepID=A0ABD7MNX4_SHISO|nr:endodeoxyribonuclease RUS [Shigella sonnei]CSS20709.1 endodeoxyribonuclease RUS [Shigella sonnei]CSW65981.1 endodeoxyribonuclease RUS [Shigella sonnei]SIY35481.1 endodeoxyribonuclease RUS [Shigella sonnei]SIY52722.1 endodeoxyribonuclease RUS [Shigella sonnei]